MAISKEGIGLAIVGIVILVAMYFVLAFLGHMTSPVKIIIDMVVTGIEGLIICLGVLLIIVGLLLAFT